MGAIIAGVVIIVVILLLFAWRMMRAGEPTESVTGRPAEAQDGAEPVADRDVER